MTDETLTARETSVLIQQAIHEHDRALPKAIDLDQKFREFKLELLRDLKQMIVGIIRAELPAMLRAELPGMLNELGYQPTAKALPSKARKIRVAQLPPIDQMVRVYAQYFDNRAANKKLNARRTNQQVKLYVWIKGTEVVGEFFMPLMVPNTAYARKRVGNRLDYLPTQDAWLVGCLSQRGQKAKFPDQAVLIERNHRLRLFVRGTELDFGLPNLVPDDADDGAASMRWNLNFPNE